MSTEEEKKQVNLKEEYIVLLIPATTVEVTISAKVWHDGEIINVERTMPFEEVKEAFKEAEEGYIPSDAVFTLTDAAKENLESIKARYADLENHSCLSKA